MLGFHRINFLFNNDADSDCYLKSRNSKRVET
jgi:hypothetical protein